MSSRTWPPSNPVARASPRAFLISTLSTALAPIGGAALAIVLVTIAVRLVLHPLNRSAVRGERARARLTPQVAAIRAQHGKNPTRMGQELQELYRSERISPFAGFLPLLIQAPIFLVLYRAFATSTGSLAGASLFGVPLHTRFVASALALGPHILVFLAVFALLVALAMIGSRRAAMLARVNAAAVLRKQPGLATAAATTAVADGAAEVMGRIGQIAPFLILISGAVLPLAVVLYLLTTTAWSTAENALLRRGLPA